MHDTPLLEHSEGQRGDMQKLDVRSWAVKSCFVRSGGSPEGSFQVSMEKGPSRHSEQCFGEACEEEFFHATGRAAEYIADNGVQHGEHRRQE